jgi:two-component sensor histidine kinase
MNELKPIDRFLRVSLFLFVALAAFVYVRYVLHVRQLEENNITSALQRAQQMLQLRLDASFHEWSEDLLEEAAVIEAKDSLDPYELARRWSPLLSSHWSVISIRVADEAGNENGVYRQDTLLYLVRTAQDSTMGKPVATRMFRNGACDTLWQPWSNGRHYDPRERVWFSKALENDRDVPAWSIRQFGDSTARVLQVSYLIRKHDPEAPYRVIVMDVDLDRSPRLDAGATIPDGVGSALISADGRVLFTGPSRAAQMAPTLDSFLSIWQSNRAKKQLQQEVGGIPFRAHVQPYSLVGLSLHTITVQDVSKLEALTANDRLSLWVGGAMLFLLIVLLSLSWYRGHQRGTLAKRQARQVEHQSRKLDKVIGEREVLSREVHHRVKNNLQVVSSLLNLQASSLDDGPVREEFLRGKRRIDMIALVHHKLYGLADLRNVDLSVLLNGIVGALAEMHKPQSRTVSVSVTTEGIKCDQDTAIELGIILCELLTNAYQHAFPYATGGHVDVSVGRVDGDLHRLIVRNNGVGLPHGYNDGHGKLGLELVDALAGQLDGSLHVRSNEDVTFEVLFRMRRTTRPEPPTVEA